MIKKEATVQTLFNKYLRKKRSEGFYCYYELKIGKKDVFYFSAIEVNQLEGLPVVEKEGLVWKFSDEDQRQKPCDGISAPPLPAYLVIFFENAFYMIRIKVILKMINNGEIRITKLQAIRFAEHIIHI